MNENLPGGKETGALHGDLELWRILRKGLRTSLAERGIDIGDDEASLVTRFMLEYVEKRGFRVVPARPTSAMHLATRQALDVGKRMTVSWVGLRAKQRWRYEAAIAAGPSWRRGYEHDRNSVED